MAVLEDFHRSFPIAGESVTPLRESVAWVYLQCLLFIEVWQFVKATADVALQPVA